MNDVKQTAKELVKLGFPIIPICPSTHQQMTMNHREKCKSPGKAPIISNWQNKNVTTEEEIDNWFNANQFLNIGVPLGSVSNLVGLDIDGVQGEQLLNALSGGDIPQTWEYKTGNGRRLLYRIPEGMKTKKVTVSGNGKHEEFAILCDGQQTVLPPSIHHSGRTYNWAKGKSHRDIELSTAPEWVLQQINANDENGKIKLSEPVTKEEFKTPVGAGERNNKLTRLAGSLLANSKVDKDDAKDFIKDWNKKYCEPPLPENEIDNMIESIFISETMKSSKRNSDKEKQQFRATPMAKLFLHRQAELGYSWKYALELDVFFKCSNFHPAWRKLESIEVKSEVRNILIDEEQNGSRKWDTNQYINETIEAIKTQLLRPYEKNIFDLGFSAQNPDLEYNPLNYICLKNGILKWKDKTMESWTSKFYTTALLPIEYNPESTCPEWEKALIDWVIYPETISFLQEYVGLCLIPDTSYRLAVFLYGTGANGKSIFLDTIRTLFGENIVSIPLHRISNRFETAYLQNKLVNICGDIDSKYIQDTGVLKTIIGGDIDGLRGEYKHGKSFDFTSVTRLMFSANALPKVADKSLAWYSRWKFVEFPKTFPINPAYKFQLMKSFDKEKSGIFNWALEGLIRLKQTNEFTKGTALLEAEREYRHENDNVSAFLDEIAIKSNQSVTSAIPTFTLHSMYNDWIEKHLDGSVAVGQVEFTKRIKALGIKKQPRIVNNKSCNCFLGIILKPEYESLYEYHEQIRKMQR